MFNRQKYPQVVHQHLQQSITRHVYNGNIRRAQKEITLLEPIEVASFKADLEHILHLLNEAHTPERT